MRVPPHGELCAGAAATDEDVTWLAVIFYLMIVILSVTIFVVFIYLTAIFLKRIWTGTLFQNGEKKNDKGLVSVVIYHSLYPDYADRV